jgi:4-hydroxy-tetrahydrodipicolinate synthase
VRHELSSVVAIPVTPFADDGGLDEPALVGLISRMAGAGVRVMTPNGNTGEFSALAPAETPFPVRVAVETMSGEGAVIAGVGFDTATAVAMGRSAMDAGADGVMIHQPAHPYRSAPGWVAYHRVIASALPDTSVVLYVKDPAVNATMLRELVEACPNVVGVKYAVADVARLASLVDGLRGCDLAWICGLAEPWAPFFWLAGATGFTSGLANVEPRLSLRMLSSLAARDYDGAMDVWRAVRPFEDLRARRDSANNVSVVKEALAQLGLCDRRVRPPLAVLDAAERDEVSAVLAAWAALSANAAQPPVPAQRGGGDAR